MSRYVNTKWPNENLAGVGKFEEGFLETDDPRIEQHVGFGTYILKVPEYPPAPIIEPAPEPESQIEAAPAEEEG